VNKRRLALGAILLAGVAAAFLFARELRSTDAYTLHPSRNAFAEFLLPSNVIQELMDIGVADINGDDWLDIFTSNHNTRQYLWVADGKGGYRDMLTTWGLDQDTAFPGSEISEHEPDIDRPGVYIYWKPRDRNSQFTLVIRSHRIKEVGRLDGTLATFSTIRGADSAGFAVQPPVSVPVADSLLPRTTVAFSSESDGLLNLEIGSPGVPITLRLNGSIPLTSVYVGRQKVSPRSSEIELAFQDRHGMAWFDLNEDGWLDVFTSRGAIGGTLRMFPPGMQDRIGDELLLSQATHRYRNVARDVGIEKKGCSGRKVTWVDYDHDGLADLFINCMERGYVAGTYPKQLYRQDAGGRFTDVAAGVGLDLAGHEVIDFVWFDVDNDGYVDLLTSEGDGFHLYRNHGGNSFSGEFIGRGKFARADRPELRGTADEYWFVDGKLAVTDFDGDGSLDVFFASKKGNMLMINDGKGRFSLVDPATRGLPAESATAGWVDFDNDGLSDLFAVPQGLFRQRPDHSFEATGLLAFPSRKYMAAIVSWADLDNDGRRDLLIARLENFSFWTWWERLYKTAADRFTWKLNGYRNTDNSNHWLQVRLVGKRGNLQAIGAHVTLETGDGQQTQVVGLNDGAFFSQGHYRLYFGLGSRARGDVMRIRWPDGQVQELRNVEGDQLHVIRQTEATDQGTTK